MGMLRPECSYDMTTPLRKSPSIDHLQNNDGDDNEGWMVLPAVVEAIGVGDFA